MTTTRDHPAQTKPAFGAVAQLDPLDQPVLREPAPAASPPAAAGAAVPSAAPDAAPNATPGSAPSAAPPSWARRDLQRLLALYLPDWHWMAAGALLSLVTLLANVALMAVSGWFIASMALAGLAGASLDYFTPAALIRGMAITRTVGRYFERVVTHDATLRLLAQLRVWFYTRIEPLAPAGLQTLRGADLLSRIHADIDALNHVYLRVFVPVVVGALGTLISVAVMACFSVPIALAAAAGLLVAGVVLPAWLFWRGRAPGAQLVAARAALRAAVVDTLEGLSELRVYGALAAHEQHIDRLSAQLCAAQRRMSALHGIAQGGLILCATLALWGALWLAAPRMQAGLLDAPDVAMLALFVLASFEAVAPLPQALQMLGETLAAARRIFSLADTSPLLVEAPDAAPLPRNADLCLHNVTLRYRDGAAPALQQVSFELRAGQRLAVVGASGAGKSSLVNLLLRFWDYSSGSITLGGVELRTCAGEDVRRHIAVVSQDTYLFNATIRDNLLVARPEASQEELEAACRDAQLHDFIVALPAGYDTELGAAGARLSGGQARRLGIARALLCDAPLLILDEPTEGLDTLTERALLQAIMRLMQGRSVLLITHRLSALSELVDRIVVLEQGRVVQQGAAHAVMNAAAGPYRELGVGC
jgi:ATP-binding cassette subfamily C protein CydC